MDVAYKGLANIGATCYMNSLLQTLFMTLQFRDAIYQWKYNQKIHPPKQDAILYQLQKLFAKLELHFPGEINTKQLVRSFQWLDGQAADQQDIQEFNRILFEALQKSFNLNKDYSNSQRVLKELYQGELIQYTKCLECHTQSSKEQSFQDLILIIKNQYQKIYNQCIQLSLQRYIKPELLDENNLYDCNYCQKKVRAERGVKFLKLPKLLNVSLQRFNFDYNTMTRQKINDKITFPFILNFNTFIHGYDQIANKIEENTENYFLETQIIKKSTKTSIPQPKYKTVSKIANGQPSVVGKIKTKPSTNTKSFLQEMRKKKMEQANQNEDLFYINGKTTVNEQNNEIRQTKTDFEIKKQQSCLQNQKIESYNKKQVDSMIAASLPPPPPPPPLLNLSPPSLTEPYNLKISENKIKGQISIGREIEKKIQEKQNQKQQREKALHEQMAKNKQKIVQYLKDGSLVYELYSVMIHSGTATAGHYYSYIRSSETNRWYCFNDERVTEINILDIQKSFGGVGNANAYSLYYRIAGEEQYQIQSKVPDYILKTLKQEEEQMKIKEYHKFTNLENTIILKVYFQLSVKSIELLKSNNLDLLFEKSLELFNIVLIKDISEMPSRIDNKYYIKRDNLRLRLFNPGNQTKLDTFTNKQFVTFEQLKIGSYTNFLLELKNDSETFDEYIPGFMTIRIALWQDNKQSIVSLDQNQINLHKVSINRFSTMKQVQQIILLTRRNILQKQNRFDRPEQGICIIKRHKNDEYSYHQIVNLSDYHKKTVEEVMIMEGEVLYIQEDEDSLNWPKQFENQLYRINVKFIYEGTTNSLLTDSRIFLNELKSSVCALINQSPEETIVKRGNRSGLQIKNGDLSLKQNRFINGTTLYLEKGIPAKQGEIRIQLFLAHDAPVKSYNRLHEFQFIADVPINGTQKASQIKHIFLQILKKVKGIEANQQDIRIRQKVNDKMGKIYRERPLKQQQLIQKRQIAIELAKDTIQMKEYEIYVRIWDQLSWTLSPKYELLINKSTTMKQLSNMIYERIQRQKENYDGFFIKPDQMDICKILSIHKFSILDLVDMEYFKLDSEVNVLSQPLFVNSDGLLFIVKNGDIDPRDLTKEQEILFGGKVKPFTKPVRRTTGTVAALTTKKQKGVSIKVIGKTDLVSLESQTISQQKNQQ